MPECEIKCAPMIRIRKPGEKFKAEKKIQTICKMAGMLDFRYDQNTKNWK